jgi:hypothetical protein
VSTVCTGGMKLSRLNFRSWSNPLNLSGAGANLGSSPILVFGDGHRCWHRLGLNNGHEISNNPVTAYVIREIKERIWIVQMIILDNL